MSDIFAGAKLVVVKVGSALLVDGAKGELRRDWLASLCDDIAGLKKNGLAVVAKDICTVVAVSAPCARRCCAAARTPTRLNGRRRKMNRGRSRQSARTMAI